eukprot:4804079-Lingulodinium_polyedra.AAC.1
MHYVLCAMYYVLQNTHCAQHTAHNALPARNPLCTTHCAPRTVHNALRTTYCAQRTVHYVLRATHYA